ncbi:Hypothetical predicted protein, partial [Paramuricea clavata]
MTKSERTEEQRGWRLNTQIDFEFLVVDLTRKNWKNSQVYLFIDARDDAQLEKRYSTVCINNCRSACRTIGTFEAFCNQICPNV